MNPNQPSFRLLVLRDDAERDFAYTSGAERTLKKADTSGWTVVSMKDDFATVFASHGPRGRDGGPLSGEGRVSC